ncbi:MAG: neutral/alkaline non-lysosomal ceramidase N-terminal domain-containing protein [Clostridia bacterium]|nr:neutral/alkaline non-lysosomal ceramidase N-terminal domain-containing protein [Clostridia bacterium]
MAYKLNLGVAQGIITPEIGTPLYGYAPDVFSESVSDDLTATAYYFSEGETKALIIEATVCAIKQAFCDEIRAEIEKETGVSKEHVIIHATHTHSGPSLTGNPGWGGFNEKYAYEIFKPNVLKIAKESLNNVEPVKMGISVGESLVGVNRRERLEDNTVKLGQNPWGPYDPKMTVISFKTESGEIKASMVHYGCHGTAAGRNHEISRDWPGFMVDAVSEHGGGICAFFNGPEGDVGPRLMNGKTIGFDEKNGKSGNIKCAEELGHFAAHDAVRILRSTHGYYDAGLEVLPVTVKIPVKPRPTLKEAEAEYNAYKEYTTNWRAGRANYYKRIIDSYEAGVEDVEYYEMEQTIIRIGEVAFVQSTFELFSEIGLRIQKHSPIPVTLPIVNTNGSDAYFVTESELCRGGYEIAVFGKRQLQCWVDNGDWYLIKNTLENLRKLKGD